MSSSQWISATVRAMPRSSSCSMEMVVPVGDGLSMRASPESRALLSNAVNLSAKEMRVLVTAGAAGIGRASAQTFLDQGARVHVFDIGELAVAIMRPRN